MACMLAASVPTLCVSPEVERVAVAALVAAGSGTMDWSLTAVTTSVCKGSIVGRPMKRGRRRYWPVTQLRGRQRRVRRRHRGGWAQQEAPTMKGKPEARRGLCGSAQEVNTEHDECDEAEHTT